MMQLVFTVIDTNKDKQAFIDLVSWYQRQHDEKEEKYKYNRSIVGTYREEVDISLYKEEAKIQEKGARATIIQFW